MERSVSERQVKQFDDRLKRIQRIQRRGGGFEAAGTLGQSYYTRLRRRAGRPVLRPALMTVAMLLLFKAVLLAHLGAGAYTARLEALASGGPVERAGAVLMAADPITLRLAEWIVPLLPPAP
jgi:hypothetical protein